MAGLVNEITLLNHMLDIDHDHRSETIANMLQPVGTTYAAHTFLDEVLPHLAEGNAIIVADGVQTVGILTKIDILDYISTK